MGKQSIESSVAMGAMNGNPSMKNRIEKGMMIIFLAEMKTQYMFARITSVNSATFFSVILRKQSGNEPAERWWR